MLSKEEFLNEVQTKLLNYFDEVRKDNLSEDSLVKLACALDNLSVMLKKLILIQKAQCEVIGFGTEAA